MSRMSKPALACCLLMLGCLAASASAQSAKRNLTADQQRQLNEAKDLNSQATKLHREGKLREGIPLAKQALEICLRIHGEEHTDTGLAHNNLALLFHDLRDLPGARTHYEQALQIYRKILGAEHERTATVLNNLGGLLVVQGDYATARQHYEQALRIRKATLGDEDPKTATTLNNLGALLKVQGDYAAARPYYEESLRIKRKVLGEKHSSTATSLNSLGMLLKTLGEYPAARKHLEQALRINREVLGDEHPNTASTLNNLGGLLRLQGDYDAARRHFEESLKIKRKVLGDRHSGTASSLISLGMLLKLQGKYSAARPYLEEALKIDRAVLGDDHPSTAICMNNVVLLDVATDRLDAAAKLTDEVRRGVRRHVARVLPSLGDREQLSFLEEKYEAGLQGALSLALLQSKDPTAATRSAAWLVNGKAVGQESLVARTLLARDLADPESAAVARELQDVRQRLAALTLSTPEPGREAARQTRIGVFDFKATGNVMRRQAARYAAWIVPAAGQGNVQIVDLGAADAIEQAVAAARISLQAAAVKDGPLAQRGEEAAETDLRADLQKLADLVWKPLAGRIGSATTLVISPDASLWLLPWAALPVGKDKYLIEEFSLRYAVSGRDLVATHADFKTTTPALFADPAFDLDMKEIQAATKSVFPKSKLPKLDTRGLSAKHGLPKFSPLPGTAAEIQAIAPHVQELTGKVPKSYVGRLALETVVKNVQRPAVLALSTHGYFLPDQESRSDSDTETDDSEDGPSMVNGQPTENPLLRCGLLFAGCNQRQSAGGDDGVLTGLEICGIDLRGTDLVVLSACETGVGTTRNGEGVAGLRQAFQLAGAKSVVATLWQIPDVESARIMNDFFANLAEGQSKADALRNAQLKRIAARREKYGAAHPYFWAAYTLTGQ